MQLNFKVFGEGVPVVILHGLFGSLDNWLTFARRLSSGFKVFIVDLRNHGKSPHNPEHSYGSMANDLHTFFETNQISKAHLIGHSMGGKAAMQFAIRYPEKLLKLIVVDISPRTYGRGHDEIFNALMSMNLSSISKREEAEIILSEKISDSAVRQFLLKNLDRKQDGSFNWKMNLQALFDNYENINAPLSSERPVNIPVIVIRGEKSAYVQEDDLPFFKTIFPDTQCITIPGAGHWVHAEAPDAFFEKVRQTLSAR